MIQYDKLIWINAIAEKEKQNRYVGYLPFAGITLVRFNGFDLSRRQTPSAPREREKH